MIYEDEITTQFSDILGRHGFTDVEYDSFRQDGGTLVIIYYLTQPERIEPTALANQLAGCLTAYTYQNVHKQRVEFGGGKMTFSARVCKPKEPTE